jgi:hypothetical protein
LILLPTALAFEGVWNRRAKAVLYACILLFTTVTALGFQFYAWGFIYPDTLLIGAAKAGAIISAFGTDLGRALQGRPNFGPARFRDLYQRWSLPFYASCVVAISLALFFKKTFPIYPAPQKIDLNAPKTDGPRSKAFPFQIQLPTSTSLVTARPDQGYLVLKVGKEHWMLDRTNYLDSGIETMPQKATKLRLFLSDRFGSIPRVLKSLTLGDRPSPYIVAEGPTVICAASLDANAARTFIKAYFWNEKGEPRGELTVLDAQPDRDLSQWIRSLELSVDQEDVPSKLLYTPKVSPNRSPEAGLTLGFNAMENPKDPSRVQTVIQFFDATGQTSLAKAQRKALQN